MENRNICKFNINRSGDLLCENFVYETKNRLTIKARRDKYLLGIVICGQGTLVKGEKRFPLCEGCLFMTQKNEEFHVDGEDMEYCYITFDGRRAAELYERCCACEENCVLGGYERICEFWMESLRSADESNIDLMAEAVLLYSFACMRPMGKKQNDLIGKMIAVIDEQFTSFDFSLAALAEHLGYDAKYLSFQFKQKKGVTFTEYLRDVRMKHALFLMEQGVVSVKNIAILSGFGDALYFSRIFKREMGVSPKEYIESLNT